MHDDRPSSETSKLIAYKKVNQKLLSFRSRLNTDVVSLSRTYTCRNQHSMDTMIRTHELSAIQADWPIEKKEQNAASIISLSHPP